MTPEIRQRAFDLWCQGGTAREISGALHLSRFQASRLVRRFEQDLRKLATIPGYRLPPPIARRLTHGPR
jgi:Homeodomain-like domain